jgi:hypothetical protein
MVAAFALLLALQQRGLEVTDLFAEAALDGDIAVVKLTLQMRNWEPSHRQADFTFRLPAGAVPLDLDSRAAADPDVETVLPAIAARRQVLELAETARRTHDHDPRLNTVVFSRPRQPVRQDSGHGSGSSRPRDPQLLEEAGTDTYRLRVYPIEPATVYVIASPGVRTEIGRDAGPPVEVQVTFAQRLRKPGHGDATEMDWGLRVGGSNGLAQKTPPGTMRLVLPPCLRFRQVAGAPGIQGTAGGRHVFEGPLNAGRLTFTTGPSVISTGGDLGRRDHAGCDHDGAFDMTFVREALEADARVDSLRALRRLTPDQVREAEELGRRYKLVTRWTSILRADASLYEARRKARPAQAPDRIDREPASR